MAIATDVPEITSRTIAQAMESLNRYDVVIGPASDGGYYLIGMNQLHEEIFHNIDWSTDIVLAQTTDATCRLGLSHYLLPELADIDTEDDLLRWAERANIGHPLHRFLRNQLWKRDEYEANPGFGDPGASI